MLNLSEAELARIPDLKGTLYTQCDWAASPCNPYLNLHARARAQACTFVMTSSLAPIFHPNVCSTGQVILQTPSAPENMAILWALLGMLRWQPIRPRQVPYLATLPYTPPRQVPYHLYAQDKCPTLQPFPIRPKGKCSTTNLYAQDTCPNTNATV